LRSIVLLLGCAAASPDPGTQAALQIADAQFNPGALPGEDGGPQVVSMNVSSFTVAPGAVSQPLLGTLAPAATAVGIALDGDRGWWLLVAGVPDSDSPTMPTFKTSMSFARTLAPGPLLVRARAIDAQGRFGASAQVMLMVAGAAPNARLAVTLSWASPVDLDLHVVDPGGAEIWSDAPMSPSGGVLDADSNSQCVIDGHDEETVSWTAPPPGHYLVRIDTFSLCGQPIADWRVEATLDGVSLGVATGVSVDADTWGRHQRGSGREALAFDVP
jgi:hypothetical protein